MKPIYNPLLSTVEDLILADLSVLPVMKDKSPAIAGWKQYQSKPMTMEEAANSFASLGVYGVAVICGKVSGGVECIDFDAHGKDIEKVFNEWSSDQGVTDILNRNKLYIEKSPRGGYHVMYRYESDVYEGAKDLALWENGESMIETRGEGGYIIVSPTLGYETLQNLLTDLATIQYDEREYLISHARNFNQQPSQQKEQVEESKGYDHTDPVSWFNWHKGVYAKKLLEEKGWVLVSTDKQFIENWRRPGKTDGISATWGKKHNALFVFTSSVAYFQPNCYYTPFQILVRLRFKGNYNSAVNWVVHKYFNEEIPYVRVGTDYFKMIYKADRFGVVRGELKAWKKEEIKQDHGSAYINNIPKFDDYTIEPNNFSYRPVINNCYNLYREFSHRPVKGEWYWTEILMRQIFGEQYALGIRYLQALYLHPDRILPIVVLVSRERQTGKTTFLNWLNMIFGDNMVMISPEDLTNSFNHIYATSNLIAIEETLIEKSITVEKLKSLATGKFISVNQKWVQQYKIPFYGKIILASNNEDKFARIDEEEIRFFVLKVGKPTIMNHNIEKGLAKEIPAFLHYLTTLPPIDWSKDRSGFTPDELSNDTLRNVKEESKNWLYKELVELITDWFNNNSDEELYAIPADIKNKWFSHNSRADIAYIRTVIKNDFKLTPELMMKYMPLGGFSYDSKKAGTPFKFERRGFTDLPKEDAVKNIYPVKEENVPF